MMKKKWHKDPVLITFALGLITLLVAIVVFQKQDTFETGIGGDFAGVPIGGPYELISDSNKIVSDQTFEGQYKLIYFGFTYCPAICPTELQKMTAALNALPQDIADQIQPLFITIDPERDSVGVMREYVALFHPKLVGLTGTPTMIKKAADAYRVYYSKVEDEQYGEYTMDHSSFIYFMGPDDNLINIYKISDTSQTMAKDIKAKMQ